MTKIKICGLRRSEDIDIVNRYLPDYAGFILAENRVRTITENQLAELKSRLNPSIQAVAVFVNQDPAYPALIFRKGLADYIQLHGSEDESYIHELRKEAPGVKIIKAFNIEQKTDIRKAMESSADLILLDHGKGGTGSSFDWRLITDIDRDYILAGGLNPQNVEQAVKELHPYAVDVSSGVETDGYKDEMKVKTLIETVRKETVHE